MKADKVIKNFQKVQNIFRVAAALQLAGHLWPKPTPVLDNAEYDYIIVGGGTAGCVIASRLAELREPKILLIEAGGDPPYESIYTQYFAYLKQSNVDWNFTSLKEAAMEHHKGGVAKISQGKMLGGSSSLGFMYYARGNPNDYNHWASITNDSTWSYISILPLFIKSEKLLDRKILSTPEAKALHGTKGKLKLRKFYYNVSQVYLNAFRELGNKILVNINARNPLGYSNALFTSTKTVRQSTAYTFLRSVKGYNNLHIMTHTTATKVIFDKYKNAIAVQVRRKDDSIIHIRASKEIILTAGVFKTPHILMVSGVGPKKHLRNKNIKVLVDLPVGQNLRDHPTCLSVFRMGKLPKIDPKQKSPYKFQFPVLDGYVTLTNSTTIPSYGTHSLIIDDARTFLTLCTVTFSFQNSLCETLLKRVGNNEMFVVLNHLTYPNSRGEVHISKRGKDAKPVIKLNFYKSSKDLTKHARAVMDFNKILTTTYFKKVKAKFVDPGLEICRHLKKTSLKYWKCYVMSMATTLHSNVGTCAMGTVVNSNLFVKGVKRLRVADSSVMPTLTASPPMATVVMIAEKAAKMIREDYNYNKL